MSAEANLFAQQVSNRRRSALLVAGFLALFAWVGFGGDAAFYLGTTDAGQGVYRHRVPWFGLAAILLGAGFVWRAYRTGARRVLWAAGAREVVSASSLAERQLLNVVDEMAIAAGVPRPRVWIVPDPDPNAFATGTDPAQAHVAVTEGLLARLDRDELQGVVAHELAHVRNLDVRLMTLLAALVGAIALISEGAYRVLRGGFRGGRSGGRGKGGATAAAIALVVWLLTLLVAPLVSRVLALAVSRKREFLADATSAQFTRNPAALAQALEKIHAAVEPTKSMHSGTAHLCIADPLGRRVTGRQGWLADILATHPPMAVRIARLKAMAYQQGGRPGTS